MEAMVSRESIKKGIKEEIEGLREDAHGHVRDLLRDSWTEPSGPTFALVLYHLRAARRSISCLLSISERYSADDGSSFMDDYDALPHEDLGEVLTNGEPAPVTADSARKLAMTELETISDLYGDPVDEVAEMVAWTADECASTVNSVCLTAIGLHFESVPQVSLNRALAAFSAAASEGVSILEDSPEAKAWRDRARRIMSWGTIKVCQ